MSHIPSMIKRKMIPDDLDGHSDMRLNQIFFRQGEGDKTTSNNEDLLI